MKTALLSLFLCGCAAFDAPPYWHMDMPGYNAPWTIMYTTQEEVVILCKNQYDYACAIRAKDRCTIVLGPHTTECIIKHEMTHCRGWSHDEEPGDVNNCGETL